MKIHHSPKLADMADAKCHPDMIKFQILIHIKWYFGKLKSIIDQFDAWQYIKINSTFLIHFWIFCHVPYFSNHIILTQDLYFFKIMTWHFMILHFIILHYKNIIQYTFPNRETGIYMMKILWGLVKISFIHMYRWKSWDTNVIVKIPF